MAEGGGLLNRYTLQRRIEGSNPSGSASTLFALFAAIHRSPYFMGISRIICLCGFAVMRYNPAHKRG